MEDKSEGKTHRRGRSEPVVNIYSEEPDDEAEAALIAVLEKRDRRVHRHSALPSTATTHFAVAEKRHFQSNTPESPLVVDAGQISSSRRRLRKLSSDGGNKNDTGPPNVHRSLYDIVKLAKEKGYGNLRPAGDPSSSVPHTHDGRIEFAEFAEKTQKLHYKFHGAPDTSKKSEDIDTNQSKTHRKNTSGALPFEGIGGVLSLGRSAQNLIADDLFENVEKVESLFLQTEATDPEEEKSDHQQKENLKQVDEEAGPNVITPLLNSPKRQESMNYNPRKKCKLLQILNDVLDPGFVCMSTLEFLVFRFLFIMVPLLAIAAILFYKLGNPEIDFLPLRASISWWLIFVVRQLVTLQLAYCSQYFFVDMLALRSTLSVKVFGPLMTLFSIQGKGWPFVVAFWGLWDLLLLHGEQTFQKNWLHFTGIRLFSSENTDNGLINNNVYLRILLSMLIAGGAVAVKRTYMALYLGKRTFFHFKQQLGSLVTSMLLISEIADLAEEATDLATLLSKSADGSFVPDRGIKTSKSAKRWIMNITGGQEQNTDTSYESDGDEVEDSSGDDAESSDNSDEHEKKAVRPSLERSIGVRKSGGIKNMLENWKEPENKLDDTDDPSIHDILHFRRVLSFLDESYPFTTSFGPADSRDSCISSSQSLYTRLLKLAPGDDTLPFDVIKIVAFDEYGQLNEEKVQLLLRLFRPNKFNKITMLAFVQTCDSVYKKLRYFRASVANSTLIDRVLEQILNTIFYFVLILVLLAVLNLNPWTLLVSMSTLVVSFAFALGPSVSKLIEGILLIVLRRPYDLGDRLIITNAEFVGNGQPGDSWFVEDVTLTTTTLRFASSNEVATINNGAIANARIINASRSPNALVNFDLLFRIEVTHEEIAIFRAAVEKYIKDNPRKWAKMVFLRINRIDPNAEFVEYTLRLQHVKGWQEQTAILMNKGEMFKFCTDLVVKQGRAYLGVHQQLDVHLQQKNTEDKVVEE